MVYQWRDGYSAAGKVDPATASTALEKIREENGGLEPVHIVDAARPDNHPLHPVFTWDDNKAAEAYRRWEARVMVRALVIVRTDDGETQTEPVYVSTIVKTDDTERRYYQRASILVNRPDELEAAIDLLKDKMQSAAAALDAVRRLAEAAQNKRAMRRLATARRHMEAAAVAVQGTRTGAAAVAR